LFFVGFCWLTAIFPPHLSKITGMNLQGAAMWAHDLEKRQHIVAQQKGLKLD